MPDSASLDLPGAFTIETWVKPGAVDNESTIIEKRLPPLDHRGEVRPPHAAGQD